MQQSVNFLLAKWPSSWDNSMCSIATSFASLTSKCKINLIICFNYEYSSYNLSYLFLCFKICALFRSLMIWVYFIFTHKSTPVLSLHEYIPGKYQLKQQITSPQLWCKKDIHCVGWHSHLSGKKTSNKMGISLQILRNVTIKQRTVWEKHRDYYKPHIAPVIRITLQLLFPFFFSPLICKEKINLAELGLNKIT